MNHDDTQPPLTDITTHSPDELTSLRERRSALQEMARIALSVEKLRQGLSALLLAGKPPDDMPESALTLFEELSKSVRHYTNQRLRESLTAIEAVVRENIDRIMSVADNPTTIEQATHDQDNDNRDLHGLIHEFRRHVQTAVALGLLLHERGIPCPEFRLPVTHEAISNRIGRLVEEERRCRQRLQDEMQDMLGHVERLQHRLAEGPALEELREIHQQLQANLSHLARGERIEEMPVVFEMIEIGSAEDHRIPFSPTSLPTTPPAEPGSHPAQQTQARPDAQERSHGMRRLWKWLNTPFSVRWKDID